MPATEINIDPEQLKTRWSQNPNRNAGWLSNMEISLRKRDFERSWTTYIASLGRLNRRETNRTTPRAITSIIRFPLIEDVLERESHVSWTDRYVHVIFALNLALTMRGYSAYDFIDQRWVNNIRPQRRSMTYDRWKLLLARNQFDELMDLTKYLHLRDQRLAFWNQINDLAENSRVRGFWPRTHIVPDPPPAPRVDSVGRFIEELGRGRARVDDMQSHLSREYAARDLNDGNHLDREQLVLLIGRNEISVGAMADIAEIVFHDIRSDTIDQIHDGE